MVKYIKMGFSFKKVIDNLVLNKLFKNDDVDIKSIKNSFGAILDNKVDLTTICKKDILKLKTVLKNSGMLAIPAHRILSKKEQIKITNYFGKVNKNISYISPHTSVKKQLKVTDKIYLSSALWHCDYPCLKNPPHISVFQVLDGINENWETAFLNLEEVCANLNEDVKNNWANIKVMYSGQDVVHPLLRINPFTGKQSIYFDFRYAKEVFTICKNTGNTLLDTNKIVLNLNKLFSNQKRIYRHKWRSGDIIIIDNYAISRKETITPDNSNKPIVRRTTTEGIYF